MLRFGLIGLLHKQLDTGHPHSYMVRPPTAETSYQTAPRNPQSLSQTVLAGIAATGMFYDHEGPFAGVDHVGTDLRGTKESEGTGADADTLAATLAGVPARSASASENEHDSDQAEDGRHREHTGLAILIGAVAENLLFPAVPVRQ